MAEPLSASPAPLAAPANAEAEPGAGGLALLGLTMLIFALYLLDLVTAESVLTREGIFFGGLAMIVAGLRAWQRKNGFGASLFLGFGLFSLSLMAFVILPATGVGQAPSRETLLAYLLLWGSFAFLLFLASFALARCYRVLFAALALLLLLLVIGQLASHPLLHRAAGVTALAVAAAAAWTIGDRIRRFLA